MEAAVVAIGCFALALVCLAHEQKKLLREIADKLGAAADLGDEPDGREGEPPTFEALREEQFFRELRRRLETWRGAGKPHER